MQTDNANCFNSRLTLSSKKSGPTVWVQLVESSDT